MPRPVRDWGRAQLPGRSVGAPLQKASGFRAICSGPAIERHCAPRLMERFPEKVHRFPGITAGDLLTLIEHTNPPFHCSAVKATEKAGLDESGFLLSWTHLKRDGSAMCCTFASEASPTQPPTATSSCASTAMRLSASPSCALASGRGA